MEFAYDGGGLGKGGTASLYRRRQEGRRGQGRGDRADGLLGRRRLRRRRGHRLRRCRQDYGPHGNEFTGRVKGVQIAIAEAAENADHLVSPEEAMRVAMARQ